MSALRTLTTRVGLVRRTPPDEITSQIGGLSPEQRRAVMALVHVGVGAAAGVLFAAYQRPRRAPRWTGVAYGIGVQAAYEAAVAPFVAAPRDRPLRERLAIAADHVLYGLVLTR